MRILMLTPYLPYPPSSGGQVRSYNLLKQLGEKHEITLVALIKHESEKQYIENLKPYCKNIYACKRSETPWTMHNILKSIFGVYPFLVVRNLSDEAKKTVHKLLKEEEFDLIHAETFYIMPHIPKTSIPTLLVEQTIEYKVYQHFVEDFKYAILKPFFYYDIIKLKYWEKKYWKKADLVGVMSVEDERQIKSLLPQANIEIIPNAAGDDLSNLYSKTKKMTAPIFLYQGNFAWLQNVEAATLLVKKIFPQILKKIPNAVCVIAGQKAHEKIASLHRKQVKIVDIRASDIETVKKMYEEASIFIAPIEGPGGTRLKILGAMAAGVPVISSPTGISGLDVTDNHDVLIAKTEKAFALLAEELLHNKKKYASIRENAKKLVEVKYNWRTIAEKLENIYLTMKK